jgi:hypothetical protein
MLLWLIPVTARFPKNQRYLLGERLEGLSLDLLGLLLEARYTRDRSGLLRRCNLELGKNPLSHPVVQGSRPLGPAVIRTHIRHGSRDRAVGGGLVQTGSG